MKPIVGIVMGSTSDWETMKAAAKVLGEFGVPYEAKALSAHRTPKAVAAWTEARLFGLFPALAAMRGRLAAHMSGGEQQMLTIARTLMGNPQALLLDEPSGGLAPRLVDEIGKAILEMKAGGLSVLLCEQNLAFARRVGDRAYLLEQGEVRRAVAMSEMKDNPLS